MKFSIITVCRNNLTGLKKTYDSLFAQTFTDYEWIVIDGNSSDGTKEWLQSINNELIWISEPDDGIFDAMNKGIALAHGEYLLFLNSSDELANNDVLEKVNNAVCFSNKPPVFIYGDSIDINYPGNLLYRKSKHYRTLWRGMFTQHQAMFFRASPDILYKKEYRITADYEYTGQYLKNLDNEDIIYLETPFCKFKLGGVNESSRFKALKEDYLIRKKEFGINIFICLSLYVLHFMHTLQKRLLPGTAKILRYKELNYKNQTAHI